MNDLSPSEAFNVNECLIDELRMAGHWRYGRARANTLKAHMHRRAFEICFVAEGVAEWWAEDCRYDIRRGQFYITKPEELHGAVESSAMPDELYWVQIAFPKYGAFAGMTADETRRIESCFHDMSERVFEATFDCVALYNRILQSLRSPSELNTIALRGALQQLMVGVIEDSRGSKVASPSNPRLSDYAQTALDYIEAHLADEFSVEDIADATGIAVSHFHKVFASEIGFTPANYRSRRRIERAKHLLKQESASITDIAFDLGFSSSQYFSTVFKALTGMVPRQYRAWSRQEDPLSRTAAYVD